MQFLYTLNVNNDNKGKQLDSRNLPNDVSRDRIKNNPFLKDVNELKFDRSSDYSQFIRLDFSSRLHDLECSLTMLRLHANRTVKFDQQDEWMTANTTK